MVKKRRGLSDMLRDETQRLDQPAGSTDGAALTDQQSLQETETLNTRSPDTVTLEQPESASHGVTDSPSSRETESVSLKVTESDSARDSEETHVQPEIQSYRVIDSVVNKEPEPVENEETDSVVLPIYQRMVRKEARLHEAQYDELTRLARELNRKKRQVGEIITANTLLRVATALLLQRRTELRGDTEDELLASVSSPHASVPSGRP